MDKKAKHCPFCGKTNLEIVFENLALEAFFRCKKCHAQGPVMNFQSKYYSVKEVLELWNKRFNEPIENSVPSQRP